MYDYKQNEGPRCGNCKHPRYIHQNRNNPLHCNFGRGCSCERYRPTEGFLEKWQIEGWRAALQSVVDLSRWTTISGGRSSRYWR
jgi:hypothetical protein